MWRTRMHETVLHEHDLTRSPADHPKRSHRLFAVEGVSWAEVSPRRPKLHGALALWGGNSKVVRSQLAHSIRSDSNDWLPCGIQIDRMLLMELDLALRSVLGGCVSSGLTELAPRLPLGTSKQDLSGIAGIKPSKPRPRASLLGGQGEVARHLEIYKP